MELIIKFSVVDQANGYQALFYDLIGKYAAGNPGGFGGGVNPKKSAIVAALLDIYLPDPTTGIPAEATSTTKQTDLFARDYPFTNPIYLTPADFIAVNVIPDGIYLFKLTVSYLTGDNPPQTITLPAVYWYGAFYQEALCCAAKKLEVGCGCTKELTTTQKTVERMNLAFKSMAWNELNCQDPVKMAAALVYAQDLCANDCSNC